MWKWSERAGQHDIKRGWSLCNVSKNIFLDRQVPQSKGHQCPERAGAWKEYVETHETCEIVVKYMKNALKDVKTREKHAERCENTWKTRQNMQKMSKTRQNVKNASKYVKTCQKHVEMWKHVKMHEQYAETWKTCQSTQFWVIRCLNQKVNCVPSEQRPNLGLLEVRWSMARNHPTIHLPAVGRVLTGHCVDGDQRAESKGGCPQRSSILPSNTATGLQERWGEPAVCQTKTLCKQSE